MWKVLGAIDRLLGWVLPSECISCGGGDGPFCRACIKEAESIRPLPRCLRCGMPLAEQRRGCLHCHEMKRFLDGLFVFSDYQSPLREMLHHVKFSGNPRLAFWMGQLLTKVDFPQADAIVPVPLSKGRLIKRGFNQSLLMAEVVSRHRQVPLREGLLRKVRDIPPQSLLSGQRRLRNPVGAFRVVGRPPSRVLLLDDVYTTGATMNECARALKEAGSKEVYGLVLLRATGD